MRLYVGNVPYQASEADLEKLFTEAGIAVESVSVVRDRHSGEPRGFAFVEVASEDDGRRAIRACNGKDFLGRTLVVNEARPPRSDSGPRPGSGGRGSGGGRRRY